MNSRLFLAHAFDLDLAVVRFHWLQFDMLWTYGQMLFDVTVFSVSYLIVKMDSMHPVAQVKDERTFILHVSWCELSIAYKWLQFVYGVGINRIGIESVLFNQKLFKVLKHGAIFRFMVAEQDSYSLAHFA